MKKEEIGEFLNRFYRKRTASFLANIYKASITAESKDIHRARTDVKKIFALYGLFEMLSPKLFEQHGGYKLFRPLFRQAGKIREIQVDCILMANLQTTGVGYYSFMQWLREEELRATRKFLQLVMKFKESELSATDKAIQKICRSSSLFRLRSKTDAYIKGKAERVKGLELEEPGDQELHKIRQNLKAMSTITTLVCSIKPVKQLELVITALNNTEMMIGDWHDRVVLKDAIDRFLEANVVVPEEERISLNTLKQTLTDYNLDLVQRFMPEVKVVVLSVLNNSDR